MIEPAPALPLYAREGFAELRRAWRAPRLLLPCVVVPAALFALIASAILRVAALTVDTAVTR